MKNFVNEIRETLKYSRKKAILHYLTDLELNKENITFISQGFKGGL